MICKADVEQNECTPNKLHLSLVDTGPQWVKGSPELIDHAKNVFNDHPRGTQLSVESFLIPCELSSLRIRMSSLWGSSLIWLLPPPPKGK